MTRPIHTAPESSIMMSGDEWEENLDNIDDLISCNLGSLETEDVIYLEKYLIGDNFGSHSPILWSPLRENSEGDISPTHRSSQEGERVNENQLDKHIDEENSEDVDDPKVAAPETSSGGDDLGTSITPRQPRTTKGIPRPKFVSYQTLPANIDKSLQCQLCGQHLASRESRKRHIIAKHLKEKNYGCSDCGKKFVFKFSLKAHEAVHSTTPKFTCVCGQAYSVLASYMDHVRRVHRAVSEIRYSCEICSKSFVDHHTLRLHLISVHDPKTIPCLHTGCNKVFSTRALMKSHYWYHFKKRFPCDECGQTFSTESYMYKHRRTHSGIRPYLCVDCGKTYLSVSHLNKHRRVAHSTYRPFQCSFCGKCYKTKDQLTFHENNHRGEKPFKCEVCGYATAYRNTYYAHRKKHHTLPSTNTQNENEDKSVTQQTSLNKTINTGKRDKNNKLCKEKKSLSLRRKSSPRVIISKTSPSKKTEASHMTENTTSATAKGNSGSINLSPYTPSVNVICVVSTEPNNPAVLPEASRTISANCSYIEDQSKEMQSSKTGNFGSSQPVNLVYLSDNTTDTIHQNTMGESYELVANADIMDETSEKNSLEQTVCLISSNEPKCSFPMCDNSNESLLLFKVDEDSCVVLCTPHFSTSLVIDTVKESTSTKEMTSMNNSTHVPDNFSHQNETTDHQETSDHLNSKVVITEANVSENTTTNQSSTLLRGKLSPGGTSLVQVLSQSSSTSSLTEHRSTMDIDSEIANLSGPVVDESFSLARMEIHCVLCDEQFLCMDHYITHLESSHN